MANPMMAQLMEALSQRQAAPLPPDYSRMSDLALSRLSINDPNAAAALRERKGTRQAQKGAVGQVNVPGAPLPSTTPGLAPAPTMTNQGGAMAVLDDFPEFRAPGEELTQKEAIPADDGGMQKMMAMLGGMRGKFATGADISGGGGDMLGGAHGDPSVPGTGGLGAALESATNFMTQPHKPAREFPSIAERAFAQHRTDVPGMNAPGPNAPTLEPPPVPGVGPADFAGGGVGPAGGAGPQGVFDMMGAAPSTPGANRQALRDFQEAMKPLSAPAAAQPKASGMSGMLGGGYGRERPPQTSQDIGGVTPLPQDPASADIGSAFPGSTPQRIDPVPVSTVGDQVNPLPGMPPRKPTPPARITPPAQNEGAITPPGGFPSGGGILSAEAGPGAGGPETQEQRLIREFMSGGKTATQDSAFKIGREGPKKNFLESLGINNKDMLQFGLAMLASAGPEGIRGRSIGESAGLAGLSTTKLSRAREEKRSKREAATEKQRLEREKVQVQKQQHKTDADLKRRQIDTNADLKNLAMAIKDNQNKLENRLSLMAIKQREQAGNVNLGRLAATLASNEATTLFDIEEKSFAQEDEKKDLMAQTRRGYDQMRANFGIPVPDRGGGAPHADAVAKLKADPSEEAKKWFDQTFGPGASKRALGK